MYGYTVGFYKYHQQSSPPVYLAMGGLLLRFINSSARVIQWERWIESARQCPGDGQSNKTNNISDWRLMLLPPMLQNVVCISSPSFHLFCSTRNILQCLSWMGSFLRRRLVSIEYRIKKKKKRTRTFAAAISSRKEERTNGIGEMEFFLFHYISEYNQLGRVPPFPTPEMDTVFVFWLPEWEE